MCTAAACLLLLPRTACLSRHGAELSCAKVAASRTNYLPVACRPEWLLHMQAPTAIRAAANCFCQLLVSHSDNNVKLIVLDRLQVLSQDLPPDALRCWIVPPLPCQKHSLRAANKLVLHLATDVKKW